MVKSRNGIIFRRWANSVLKDYLIKGYAVKNSLIQERYDELKALVDTMGRAMQHLETGAGDQIISIFDVVRDYTYALDTLDGGEYNSTPRCAQSVSQYALTETRRQVIKTCRYRLKSVVKRHHSPHGLTHRGSHSRTDKAYSNC